MAMRVGAARPFPLSARQDGNLPAVLAPEEGNFTYMPTGMLIYSV